jgi:hypothetical protein
MISKLILDIYCNDIQIGLDDQERVDSPILYVNIIEYWRKCSVWVVDDKTKIYHYNDIKYFHYLYDPPRFSLPILSIEIKIWNLLKSNYQITDRNLQIIAENIFQPILKVYILKVVGSKINYL